MSHELPPLNFDFDALEPYIDAKTMEIHHDKHHAGYVAKLNAALETHKELQEKPIDELIRDLNSIPGDIKKAVQNNGGGHLNHSMFWKILKKDIASKGKIIESIKENFGSFETFKEQFKDAATKVFGSGWAWLVINNKGELEIATTSNQDNPISHGKTPVLGLDVWEHAYYLKYQNKRPEYIDAFFNVINWEQVEENFNKTMNDPN